MTFPRRPLVALTLRPALPLLCALALGAASSAQASPASDAAAYCTSTGGVSSTMHAFAGTNGSPKDWVAYGGLVPACTYTAPDTSQITLWNGTLASPAPTMAALAYYAQVPYQGGGGNPSIAYCLQLGGAWQIGDGLDGGGWAEKKGGRVDTMCVFGDGSAIDTWGLMYHSAGIVRGIDLATVLVFKNPY